MVADDTNYGHDLPPGCSDSDPYFNQPDPPWCPVCGKEVDVSEMTFGYVGDPEPDEVECPDCRERV